MNTLGVIDRMEDNQYAVILAETEGKEFVVNRGELPDGAKEGTWLHLILENEKVINMTIDHDKTMAQKTKIKNQLARIKKKSSGSKFKRK
ncbi:hypothetical protein CR194_17215 [Salipaludibacillus keqinensis]|uniref:DUF3006 domain-containing protein n=1 Tax=Salipaludibacillus keqinensis TaxID=2045207 RepID=A0A323T8C0_9BACI|nr:DUF3006 domain-containing protein [Salipaludibacillus keqinensis]PYZ91941.1 hypothetical protein CR194_17215 [Salipaludibacillus keqinensis]